MREAGADAAPIVVLLHGFPLNSAMWMPQIEALESEWRVVAPDTSRRRPELVDDLRRMILSNSPAGITGLLLAMVSRTDTTASLSRIEIPALVVVGSEDRLTPPGQAREMADRIPEARYSAIAGAGHLSNVESPDEFNRSLLDFLSSV